jgi:hypothetical protein
MPLARHESGTASDSTFALEGGLSTSLAIALAGVLVIEGAVLHLWIAERSRLWAWVLTALNVATLVWLWREMTARSRSAITISPTAVDVVVGRRFEIRIARNRVASAELATWRSVPEMAADYLNTAKPLDANVLLVLREPAEVRLPLGIVKRVSRLGIRVREPQAVIDALC